MGGPGEKMTFEERLREMDGTALDLALRSNQDAGSNFKKTAEDMDIDLHNTEQQRQDELAAIDSFFFIKEEEELHARPEIPRSIAEINALNKPETIDVFNQIITLINDKIKEKNDTEINTGQDKNRTDGVASLTNFADYMDEVRMDVENKQMLGDAVNNYYSSILASNADDNVKKKAEEVVMLNKFIPDKNAVSAILQSDKSLPNTTTDFLALNEEAQKNAADVIKKKLKENEQTRDVNFDDYIKTYKANEKTYGKGYNDRKIASARLDTLTHEIGEALRKVPYPGLGPEYNKAKNDFEDLKYKIALFPINTKKMNEIINEAADETRDYNKMVNDRKTMSTDAKKNDILNNKETEYKKKTEREYKKLDKECVELEAKIAFMEKVSKGINYISDQLEIGVAGALSARINGENVDEQEKINKLYEEKSGYEKNVVTLSTAKRRIENTAIDQRNENAQRTLQSALINIPFCNRKIAELKDGIENAEKEFEENKAKRAEKEKETLAELFPKTAEDTNYYIASAQILKDLGVNVIDASNMSEKEKLNANQRLAAAQRSNMVEEALQKSKNRFSEEGAEAAREIGLDYADLFKADNLKKMDTFTKVIDAAVNMQRRSQGKIRYDEFDILSKADKAKESLKKINDEKESGEKSDKPGAAADKLIPLAHECQRFVSGYSKEVTEKLEQLRFELACKQPERDQKKEEWDAVKNAESGNVKKTAEDLVNKRKSEAAENFKVTKADALRDYEKINADIEKIKDEINHRKEKQNAQKMRAMNDNSKALKNEKTVGVEVNPQKAETKTAEGVKNPFAMVNHITGADLSPTEADTGKMMNAMNKIYIDGRTASDQFNLQELKPQSLREMIVKIVEKILEALNPAYAFNPANSMDNALLGKVFAVKGDNNMLNPLIMNGKGNEGYEQQIRQYNDMANKFCTDANRAALSNARAYVEEHPQPAYSFDKINEITGLDINSVTNRYRLIDVMDKIYVNGVPASNIYNIDIATREDELLDKLSNLNTRIKDTLDAGISNRRPLSEIYAFEDGNKNLIPILMDEQKSGRSRRLAEEYNERAKAFVDTIDEKMHTDKTVKKILKNAKVKVSIEKLIGEAENQNRTPAKNQEKPAPQLTHSDPQLGSMTKKHH